MSKKEEKPEQWHLGNIYGDEVATRDKLKDLVKDDGPRAVTLVVVDLVNTYLQKDGILSPEEAVLWWMRSKRIPEEEPMYEYVVGLATRARNAALGIKTKSSSVPD